MGLVPFSFWTPGFPPDTFLDVTLDAEVVMGLTLGELLDVIFTASGSWSERGLNLPDTRMNPDGLDCAEELDFLVAQWRAGLCRLSFLAGRGWGRPVGLSDSVLGMAHGDPVVPPVWGGGSVVLRVMPSYRAFEWGEQNGLVVDRSEFLGWMHACSVLYLVDRLNVCVPTPGSMLLSDPCRSVVAGLYRRRLLVPGLGGCSSLSDLGRWFVGSLIAETESLIERLEIYSDVYWGVGIPVEFGVSLGHDLRVQMMMESGFDPFRGVFLLRLYGGVLDACVGDWREVVADVRVMERMVEPVVNRIPDVEPDVLSGVVSAAMAVLDGRLYSETIRGVDSSIAVRLGAALN